MNLGHFIDGPSAVIVFGGTALATLLRCGFADCKVTLSVLVCFWRRRFDAAKVQSELAVQVREIQRDGLIRANPHMFGDREFDEAAGILIQSRSVPALLAKLEAYKARRRRSADTAAQTLSQAAELAPVFGLAGTLGSLSQLPADGIAQGAYASVISMAVLTTLYGLVSANLLLSPLSRAVERAITIEENERQKLFDWLARQVTGAPHPLRETRHLDEVA